MSRLQSVLQTLINKAHTSVLLLLINVFQPIDRELKLPPSTFPSVCFPREDGKSCLANTFQILKYSFLCLQSEADLPSHLGGSSNLPDALLPTPLRHFLCEGSGDCVQSPFAALCIGWSEIWGI